ncbi:MAG: antibiotic biosynthesis monooxygenase [Ilumatobacter sp.]|uniref:antibiotic biosynthesis monooxygenase family protein n=1 Tax=Ilumatobacter sp. TaxID=1967498 RepID=UPI00260EAE12|nr:antibiotic biosynthesis monooxygenase [Ilumatobacter sp.]MDJ0771668.1 antibiotic biosynthesis monooxygenase [Ilumatobacter sp.]
MERIAPSCFTVTTVVPVEPESIDDLARLFDDTNRALVAEHDDWLGAWFTADRATNRVTVIARWRDPASYQRLRESAEFRTVMERFETRFTGPPTVTINEVLVEM